MIEALNSQYVTIKGVNVSGSWNTNYNNPTIEGNIKIDASEYITVSENKIHDAHKESLLITSSNNVSVFNGFIYDNGNSGISVTNNSSNILIDGVHAINNGFNEVDGNFSNAISINSPNCVVRNCVVEGAGRSGINLGHGGKNADNSIIENNIIKGARNAGILILEARECSIRGNQISECGFEEATKPQGAAITAMGGYTSYLTISDNICKLNNRGIMLRGIGNSLVTNNQISFSNYSGIYVYKYGSYISSFNTITNNHCSNNGNLTTDIDEITFGNVTNCGIYIGKESQRNIISTNRVKDSHGANDRIQVYGILMEGDIINNIITQNQLHGNRDSSWAIRNTTLNDFSANNEIDLNVPNINNALLINE